MYVMGKVDAAFLDAEARYKVRLIAADKKAGGFSWQTRERPALYYPITYTSQTIPGKINYRPFAIYLGRLNKGKRLNIKIYGLFLNSIVKYKSRNDF